jgi:hypothetical protein
MAQWIIAGWPGRNRSGNQLDTPPNALRSSSANEQRVVVHRRAEQRCAIVARGLGRCAR